ncbi:hypothetical protein [Methylocystis iwaonis]|uniref:Uncharacterized protein n=2 Tax=Methylocystis TaxID=133 RepID=A0ABN6VKI6_9HYPH|nr:hypothetical protein [Methylocystis iwaonis]BDV36049.1 hypothetical protein SS37A_35790 [Methylocystis iwaonis]
MALAFQAFIQDEAVGLELPQSGEAVLPIRRLDHIKPVSFERTTNEFPLCSATADDQDKEMAFAI